MLGQAGTFDAEPIAPEPGSGDQERVDALVADAHPQYLQALCEVVNLDPRLHLAGSASSGSEALALLRARRVDVVVLDVLLLGLDGFAVLRAADGEPAAPQFVVLSHLCEPEHLAEAISLGARGYLGKATAGAHELVDAVRVVAAGGVFFEKPLHTALARAARLEAQEAR